MISFMKTIIGWLKIIFRCFKHNTVVVDEAREFDYKGSHWVPFNAPYTKSGKQFIQPVLGKGGIVEPEKVYQVYSNSEKETMEVEIVVSPDNVVDLYYRLERMMYAYNNDVEIFKDRLETDNTLFSKEYLEEKLASTKEKREAFEKVLHILETDELDLHSIGLLTKIVLVSKKK